MEHNESSGAPQPDAPDNTQEFPAYQPPPPAGHQPAPPQWATPSAPGRSRSQNRVLVGLAIAMSLVLIIVVPAAVIGLTPVGDWIGIDDDGDNARTVIVQQAAPPAQAPAQNQGQGQGQADGVDLRKGAVYVQSNDAKSNEVVALARNADGTLKEVGRYKTGGTGSGSVEDNANSVVLGSVDGEAAPNHNIDNPDLLFVTNAGSNTVSVFRIKSDGLELASVTPSGGEKPVSVTVNRGLVYVLNSGEFDDRFVVGPTSILENCTHGQLPSITGFRINKDGVLTEINGSTQLLSGEKESGCAQLSFTPDGKVLVATERIAGKTNPETFVSDGTFITWLVRADGTLQNKQLIAPTGKGPFGFTFAKDGTMVVAQQNGGAAVEDGGEVISYNVGEDGTLTPNGEPLGKIGTDTCWVQVTNNGKLAFASSPFGGGKITSMAVNKDGTLSLLHSAASADDGTDANADHVGIGILDISLTNDSKYIYTIEILNGIVYGFRVNDNGTLTLVDQKQLFNLRPLDAGGEGGPFGIAAY